MANKSLYALLVAVDAYPVGVPALNGCVNDMHAFRDYLSRQCDKDSFEFKPLVFENKAATRANVIQGFQHFQNATKEDVCVLYFSGHGTRIMTNDFWEAFDGKNESILCWDSRLNGASNDLADKELSCLIYEATKGKQGMHFLVVMDCCHSGSNTRNDESVIGIRQAGTAPNARPIQSYYGFSQNLYISDGHGQYSAPKGPHIQIGACRNYQTAKEIAFAGKIRGAFTFGLIEALETAKDKMSYANLEARVGQKMENRVPNQRPQVDANGIAAAETFLGGAVAPKKRFFVAWSAADSSWELNAGDYHGISKDEFPSSVKLADGSATFSIDEIYPDHTLVSWQNAAFEPDKQQLYDVIVQQGGAAKRLVGLVDCDESGAKALLDFFGAAHTTYIKLADEPDKADFQVHAQNDTFWLTQPGNAQPIFLPVKSGYNQASSIDFWKKTDDVLQWFHVKKLENLLSSITDHDLVLELYRKERQEQWWTVTPEQMDKIADWKQPSQFAYLPDVKGKAVPSSFALRVFNNGTQALFVSALYLDGRFGITNRYLPIARLEPQKEAWLTLRQGTISTRSIGLGIDDPHFEAGLTELMDYVKIIASTAEFDTTGFEQDSLEILGTRKAMRSVLNIPGIQKPDWTTRLVPLHIVRPKDGVNLDAGKTVTVDGVLKITAPAGFSAQVSLSNGSDSTRDADDMPPPIMIEGVEPFELTQGFNRSIGLSVVALNDIAGLMAVSEENPLEIGLTEHTQLGENEVVMPFTYDKETAAWYPAGLPGDAVQPVRVTSLPHVEESAEGAHGERGLGKGLKLFLYKITVGKPVFGIIAKKIIGKQELYSLGDIQVPDVDQDIVVNRDLPTIKAKAEKAKRILLFVHGFVGSSHDHIKFVRRLNRQVGEHNQFLSDYYDLVLTFDYDSLGTPINEIAVQLSQKLADAGISPETMEGKTLHVIGHSMGGLVSRWWIEKEGGKDIVDQFIVAGTPHNGAKITKAYEFAMMALTKAVNFVPVPEVVKDITGWLARHSGISKIDDNLKRQEENSAFLKTMADLPDPGIPYTVLSGDTDKINPEDQKKQVPVFRRLLKRLGYTLADNLVMHEPNDFVVTVESSRHLPTGRQSVTFTEPVGCDHFAYFREKAGLQVLGPVLWALQEEQA